ncbi:MAG: tetratricopeptide repeat protein [Planctomycetes bacterium]|nr:tetratricopeptide repeat protein [Planctomycetota bacterium]
MSLAAAFVFALCCQTAPQGGDELFAVRTINGPVGTKPRVLVAADRQSINCLDALRGLTAAVTWTLAIESKPLENDLVFQSVDLNLVDQDPRMVAQLIAVAAGADVVFDDADPSIPTRPTVHVVRTPDPSSESGRQRLRALSGQWYRSFLRDELQNEPLVAREAVQVRMNLGQLLVDSGDLETAIQYYSEVFDRRPHDFVAAAVLRLAECHLDVAKGQTDRAVQKAGYEKAESWARQVLERMPTAPETTPATILLGRALLGQARAETSLDAARKLAERCQTELRARVIRLIDSVEMLDVWLLAAEAQLMLDQADRVYETMLTLRESPYFEELSTRQFVDYHFLLAYGALGLKKQDLAMRSIEWFLIHAENDPRLGTAYVMLAESYLAQKRFIQARAASVEARTRYLDRLTIEWRERALKIWARTALALGEKEGAFQELEQMIVRGEEPELALFLCDEMIVDRQWERAMSVIRNLLVLESPIGDRARFKKIQALYEQAKASNHLEDFPAQAIGVALKIGDKDLRSSTATIIGDAYTRLGKIEHAADAYRGILR